MTEEISTPRRLRGHKATATCCIASRDRPGVVATSGEDGCICWYDLRCKDVLFTMDLGKKPISSICFRPGNEDVVYASSGTEVMCFDVHLASSWKPLNSCNYNKDEINQVACCSKSSFLAAADDSGDIKIMDIRQQCLYKTLRAGHSSICSSVQFIPWRPWEVITGGLDAKLIMWDFSKGRSCRIKDYGMHNMESRGNEGQCFNPAFVHAVVIPDMDMLEKTDKICVVARGDGVVDVIDIESELANVKLKGTLQHRKGSQSRSKACTTSNTASLNQNRGNSIQLDYALGGHTAAVSSVAFSLFGERGKFIVSGGNDALVKVWDWSKHLDGGQNNSYSNLPIMNINLKKKQVNWLCTTPNDSENLVVCDTSKVVKVYCIH